MHFTGLRTLWPNNYTSRHTQVKAMRVSTKKNLFKYIYNSFVHNGLKTRNNPSVHQQENKL